MKKFFAKIVSFLQVLFTNLNKWIHEHVQPSIETLERLKAIVDNPITDVLTALIPGDADDKVKAWVKTYLGKAIDILGISKQITAEKDWEKKLQMLLDYLRILSPEERKGYYFRLASLMAKSSGNTDTVKGHSVDLLTQMQYSKMVEGLKAEDLNETEYTARTEIKPVVYDAATMSYK